MSRIEHPLRGALGLLAGHEVHLLYAEARAGLVADSAMMILFDHLRFDVGGRLGGYSNLTAGTVFLDLVWNIWLKVPLRKVNRVHVPCLLWLFAWLLSYRRAVPGCVTNKQHFILGSYTATSPPSHLHSQDYDHPMNNPTPTNIHSFHQSSTLTANYPHSNIKGCNQFYLRMNSIRMKINKAPSAGFPRDLHAVRERAPINIAEGPQSTMEVEPTSRARRSSSVSVINYQRSRIVTCSISKISTLKRKIKNKTTSLKAKLSNSLRPSNSSRSVSSGCTTCELPTCELNARVLKAKELTLAVSNTAETTIAKVDPVHASPALPIYESMQVVQCLEGFPACDASRLTHESGLSMPLQLNADGQSSSPEAHHEPPMQESSNQICDDITTWEDARQINSGQLLSLVGSLLNDQGLYDIADGELELMQRLEGSYNIIHVIRLPSATRYCLRVPAAGQLGRWTEQDALLMEADALTMRYIRKKSGLLMPDVLTFDTTCDNSIGRPYLLTTFINGSPMYKLWDDTSHTDLEDRRQKMLKSIAAEISKLRCLTWEVGMGTLDFEDPENPEPALSIEVDEGFPWEESYGCHRELKEVEKEMVSLLDYRVALRDVYMEHTPGYRTDAAGPKWRKGEELLLNLMINCLPDAEKFDITAPHPMMGSTQWFQLSQTFEDLPNTTMTIAPPDFNMQNIMVDDDCNVTGFIDWDGTQVVPCYRGWARYPKFLYSDWSIWFNNDYDTTWDSTELERYRKDYARYMIEAMQGEGDCIFTSKSHLYESLHEAVNLRLRRQDFTDKILGIIYPRVDPILMLERLHDSECNGPHAMKPRELKVLWHRLHQLFEPLVGSDERFSF